MIEARTVRNAAELDAALALRERVFCGEQGVTISDEIDGRDGDATHLVAIDDGSSVVGTCRLVGEDDEPATIRLGRMAVARDCRGQGVGSALLDAAHAIARAKGHTTVVLHAQMDARSLYERAGYEPTGDVFMDAGIEHVTMVRSLA